MDRRLSILFLICCSAWADGSIDPVFQPVHVYVQEKPTSKENLYLFFTCDLLIWDSKEEGLEYAYKNTGTQFNQELTSFEPPSKFVPAFRIGLGGFLPYDHWTCRALYTHYSTHRDHSASHSFDSGGTPGPGMIAVWTYPSAFLNNNTAARFQKAQNVWKLHTSFLDLKLERSCPIGSSFSIAPAFGVRSAWIHQRYEVRYNDGNSIVPSVGTPISVLSSSINMNCASNSVGPFFGCEVDWRIGNRWDLFSNASGSLLASRFHIGRGETDLFTNSLGVRQTESIRVHNEYWTFRPQGQIAFGFRFLDSVSYRNKPLRYSFSAAYEAQIWWQQNELLRYIDILNSTSSGAYMAPTQGDLMFHGFNLEAGLQF